MQNASWAPAEAARLLNFLGKVGDPSCGLTKSGAVKSQHPQASPGGQRLHHVAPGKAAATKTMYEQDGRARGGERLLQQQERL